MLDFLASWTNCEKRPEGLAFRQNTLTNLPRETRQRREKWVLNLLLESFFRVFRGELGFFRAFSVFRGENLDFDVARGLLIYAGERNLL